MWDPPRLCGEGRGWKIIGDRLRPADRRDALGVEQARARVAVAYGMARRGDAGEACCAAAPPLFGPPATISRSPSAAALALFYANMLIPFAARRNLAAYFERLKARPSYARVLEEAAPYLHRVPQ